MITEEGDKGIRELKSRFPKFNLGVRESSVNCHPRQKEVSSDSSGLLSTQTLQLTLSRNEHRKLFKTQKRSQPCSGEEKPRKSLVQPMLLSNCPLYLSMLPRGSLQILLQNGTGRRRPRPACHPHLSNFRLLLTLGVQAHRQKQARSAALHAPNAFYVNYVLYQCCDIVNSI